MIKRYDYMVLPDHERTVTLNGSITEIKFETPNLENSAPGYFIKLETIQDKKEQSSNNGKLTKSVKQSYF